MPSQVDRLGAETPFSVYVRPEFGAGDGGFNELLLEAPAGMELTYDGLLGSADGEDFSPLAAEVLVSWRRTGCICPLLRWSREAK